MICKLVLPYSNLTIHIIDIQKTFLQLLSSKSLHLTIYKYNYYFEAKTFMCTQKKKKKKQINVSTKDKDISIKHFPPTHYIHSITLPT